MMGRRARVLAAAAVVGGCATLHGADTSENACRGRLLSLASVVESCQLYVEPEPVVLEVVAPDHVEIVSGGRTEVTIDLRNDGDEVVGLIFDPAETSAVLVHGGRRVDAMCTGSAKTAVPEPEGRPHVRVELPPGGVLRVPVRVTAWAELVRANSDGCLHGDRIARGPLPSGDYELLVRLPGERTITLPVSVTPRVASLGPGWPHGEDRLACTTAADCRVVAGPCAAQSVNASYAEEILTLHQALAEQGACTDGPDGVAAPRCDGGDCTL